MAGFFDKVVDGFNRGVSTASEATKTFKEKATISTRIKDVERDKTQLLQTMGTLVYNLYKNDGVTIPQCEGLYNELGMADAKLEELQNQLKQLEEAKNQPSYYSADSVVSEEPGKTVICECGNANKEGAKFCAKCGKAL